MSDGGSADRSERAEVDQAFVREHGPWMLALATRILDDVQLAEDAVQDALLSVHSKGGAFEGRAELRTWLYRVTLNAALGVQRKRAAREVDIDELQPEFDANACRIEAPWPTLRTTEELLQDVELSAFVRQSVQALPEAYRTCLQLRDFEGLSTAEVAELLDISAENVKVRTHRARAALKRMLEPLLRGQPVAEITAAPLPAELKPSMARIAKGLMLAYMPLMITCEQFEAFLADYVEGTLPVAQKRLFEFHIRTCRECREYLAAYERASAMGAATARRVESLDEVPADLVDAVMRALD